MLKNKKLLFLLSFGLIIGLLGCSPQEDIKSKPIKLVCTVPYPPYAYIYQGKLTGIDIEISEIIAKEAGRKLEIINGKFSQLVEMVSQNKASIAACALAITNQRQKLVNFSHPYEFAGQAFLVRSNENIHFLTDMENIPGFRIGAECGSTGHMLMDKYITISQKELALLGYSDNIFAVNALLTNKIDSVILDLPVAMCLQIEHPKQLDICHDMLNHEEFAVAITKNEPELLEIANQVILRLWKSGELQELKKKHMNQAFGRHSSNAK